MFVSMILSIHIYYMWRWQLGEYLWVDLTLHSYVCVYGTQYTHLLCGEMAVRWVFVGRSHITFLCLCLWYSVYISSRWGDGSKVSICGEISHYIPLFVSMVLSIYIFYVGRWQLGEYLCVDLTLHSCICVYGTQFSYLLCGEMAVGWVFVGRSHIAFLCLCLWYSVYISTMWADGS